MTAAEVDQLPEAPEDRVGLLSDGEYALIYDSKGRAWSTSLFDGVRMKRRSTLPELDLF